MYTPRKAGKRWLDGAPGYIMDCFDNRGRTTDRYSVILGGEFLNRQGGHVRLSVLDMSGAPTHPQGVSMWSEHDARDLADYRVRQHRYRVRWADLPENIRKHVMVRAEEN